MSPSTQTQQTMAILFSDIKGYSSIKSDALKNRVVAETDAIVMRHSRSGIHLVKTMGDGLLIVSPTLLPMAEFALKLRDEFRTTDWEGLGFSTDLSIRIGLHFAEVTVYQDSAGKIVDVIGVGVDTGARIEPVTELNAVNCSDYFYRMLMQRDVKKITGVSLGQKQLAKGYAVMEIYELRWAHEISTVSPAQLPQQRAVPIPKVPRNYSDKDKHQFLQEAFESIRQYFEYAKDAIKSTDSEISVELIEEGDRKFHCNIYFNGKLRSYGRIWIGSMFGPRDEQIYFSEESRLAGNDNSYNEAVSLITDADGIYLSSTLHGLNFVRNAPDIRKTSDANAVAEYFWLRMTQKLENRNW
jgi:class 3 adenylate cyclase